MNNIVNQTPYLRTSRNFPDDPKQLTVEVNRTYIDIAAAVNNRTIGIYPANNPSITGNSFFIKNQRQQSLRQIYQIVGTGTFPHGIKNYTNVIFTQIYGVFTDGTFWYTLPWVSVVAANNQINIFLDSLNIVITGGGGGAQPVIQSGLVVLEWISPV
jgi:hypothetical protein